MANMMLRSCVTLLTTILLTSVLILAFSRNTDHGHRFRQRDADQDCTTNLARDLYGLGVRLGVYLQWASGWVSNNFLVDSIESGLNANAVFLFALMVAIVSGTRTNEMTLMDGLIMIWLSAGTVWSVLSLWGYRTCAYRKKGLNGISKFGGFGTHLRLLLSGGVAAYGAWYWIFGVKGGVHGLEAFGQVDSSCGKASVTVFNLDVAGISRNAAIALSIVAGAYAAVLILIAPLAAYTRVWKMMIFWKSKQYGSSTRLRYATGASRRQLNITSQILGGFNLFWIVFCITAIELTLNENFAIGVLGANSQTGKNVSQPGQLLPLLIGSFSFAQTLFSVFELWRYPITEDIAPSLGRASSKHWVESRVDSWRGFNIFRLFSEGNTKYEIAQSAKERSNDEDQTNMYLDLHLRLSQRQRILITAVPHLSVFYFWPWNKDTEHTVLQQEHENDERMQLNVIDTAATSGNPGESLYRDHEDSRVSSLDGSRHHSPVRYDPQRVIETV